MYLGKFPRKPFLLFPLIIFLLNFNICFAQEEELESNYTYTVGANVFQGFVIKHSENMGHLAQSHPRGFEIFVNQNTYGPKYWQQRYKFPDIGVSFSYFDLRNGVLGENFSLISYVDFNIKRRRKSNLLFKIGTGLVYTNKPYDKETNNKNLALSSWLSLTLQGRLGYNINLTDHLKLTTAISLTHFSNGGFKIPNSGINIVTYNVGFSYLVDRNIPEYQYVNEKPAIENKIKYNLFFSSGLKGLHNVEGRYFPFLNISLYADKRLNDKSAINLGLDGFYNLAVKYEVNHLNEEWTSKPDFKRVAIVGGHELFFSKLSLLTQLGVYIYRPYKINLPIYQRYGLKYYFRKNFFAGLSLKSHGGRADLMELGLGVRL